MKLIIPSFRTWALTIVSALFIQTSLAQTYRYLRFEITDASGFKIVELDWISGSTSYPTGNMTSDNSAGAVTSGSFYSHWRAFNGVVTDSDGIWTGNSTGQLTLDLQSNPITPTAFRLQKMSWQTINSFVLSGSNNNSSWTTLLTVNNASGSWTDQTFTIQTASPTKYEAESATLAGVSTATSESGYSGSGYVNGSTLDQDNDKVTFNVSVPSAGSYPLVIRFKNTCAPCEKYQFVQINSGSEVYTQFNNTANSWQDKNYGDISLNAGNNTVSIRKSWGWTHIDYITISGGSTPSNELTLNTSSLNFGSGSGNQNVSVTSNVSWTASDNQSWLSVAPSSGSGNGTLSVSVTSNTGTSQRSGTVTVTGGGITRNVSVSQDGAPASTGMKLGTNFWNFGWGNGRADYFNSGINWSTVSNPWRQQFLDDVSIYGVIRFMDQVPTNSSNVVNWSERTAKTANHYTTSNGAVAYEWQVDLCNRVGADIWITVPHRTIESYESNASNNYWTQLASLLQSQLNSNLNIYLEYSNETWSGGSAFQQGDYAGNRGVQMGFDQDHYTAKFYFHVYAAMRLHKVFLDAFAGQTHRIKTVVSGQDGSMWGTQQQMLALNNQTNSQGAKPELNPWNLTPTYYAIANYINTGDGAASNIRSAWSSELADAAQYYQQVVNAITPEGMELIAYEGGQHYTTNAHTFSQNPESYDMYLEWLETVEDYFALTCHYTHVGTWASGGSWGAKASTDQSANNAHKYRALRDWVNSSGARMWQGELDTELAEIVLPSQAVVYPNPVSGDRLVIDLSSIEHFEKTGVTLHDMSGKLIRSFEMNSEKLEVPRSEMPVAGVYLLKLHSPGAGRTIKVLIE